MKREFTGLMALVVILSILFILPPSAALAKFPVATTTQREMSISAAFDGTNYLVGVQGDAALYYNVGAQLVSPSGTLIGSHISTGRTGGAPIVGFNGTNYLIVWEDDANPPHPNDVVYGQMISKGGVAITSPFAISITIGVMSPKNVICDNTKCTVIWSNDNSTGAVYGRDISPEGSFLTSEYPIISGIRSNPGRVEVGVGADSDQNRLIAIDTGTQILGLIKGPTINKSAFVIATKIPTGTCTDHNPVGVAFDGTHYLVVWNDHSDCAIPNPAWDILAQRLDAAGNLIGSAFQVNSGNGHRAALPLLAFDGINYLVTWTDYRNDANRNGVCDPGEGTCWDIYGQFISRTGSLIGTEFPIVKDSGNQFVSPLVFGGGKYLVVWTSGDTLDGTVGDVYGAFISPRVKNNSEFDGDRKADIAIFHPGTGSWFIIPSSRGVAYGVAWGSATDIPVPGDYDGDGKTDIAIYHPETGSWFIIPSSTGVGYGVAWGGATDIPVPGDYDGDGKTDIAIFRPSTGSWFIIPSFTGVAYGVAWGNVADIPVPGDYDGDGKTDVAIYHPSTGSWFIIPSKTGVPYGVAWGGNPTDIPIPGDYDGDGKTDVAIFHPSTGSWFIIPSSTGVAYGVAWGSATDVPVPGDYDGDGKTDIAIFHPETGSWFIIPSSTGIAYGVAWGSSTDIPLTQ